jgi:4-hydroxythreonine-4-phosphate dehydrogenase
MVENKIVVGISQGDLNGIGLEIILKALSDTAITEICVPVLFSSQKTVSYFRKMLGLEDFNFNPLRDLSQVNSKKPNVFICYEEEVIIELGKPTLSGGKYAKISLETATQALLDKKIDVLVTAPINKHSMQEAGFIYPGHTEYLGEKLGGKPLMILCSGNLRVAIVTGHIPVKSISQYINTETVLTKINQLHDSLVNDFGIRKPKIAVLGLNPHAGEKGAIGDEEINAIIPAINIAKENKMVYGPYSADGFFGNNTQAQFDGVLAMYHDQGLIPFKTLAFGGGVNFTAGLNFVRTSPDHGTAYEIAGKQIADESSFREALYSAIDIYRKRNLMEEISANPLAFTPIKKERG